VLPIPAAPVKSDKKSSPKSATANVNGANQPPLYLAPKSCLSWAANL